MTKISALKPHIGVRPRLGRLKKNWADDGMPSSNKGDRLQEIENLITKLKAV